MFNQYESKQITENYGKNNIHRLKKRSRNTKRRIRRKRNQFKYYQSLRKHRSFRNTNEMCEAVNVFDISDMGIACSSEMNARSSNFPSEILEWQIRDQMAYWKSKALSLELENKMLKLHLRNVYAKTVQEYSTYNQNSQYFLDYNTQESESDKFTDIHSKRRRKKYIEEKKEEIVIPNFPEPNNRAQELEKIYGDDTPKILGMETAMQLDYERHLEKTKAAYWPNIPLKY